MLHHSWHNFSYKKSIRQTYNLNSNKYSYFFKNSYLKVSEFKNYNSQIWRITWKHIIVCKTKRLIWAWNNSTGGDVQSSQPNSQPIYNQFLALLMELNNQPFIQIGPKSHRKWRYFSISEFSLHSAIQNLVWHNNTTMGPPVSTKYSTQMN